MKPQVIAFHYDLKNSDGKQIESSRQGDPLVCLEGAGQILPKLEEALTKLKIGDSKEVHLTADEAYGKHDKDLILKVPKDQLPKMKEEVVPGHQFQSRTPDGHVQAFVVTQVEDAHVVLDGNHPLAGQDLTFAVELMERRDATDEEMAHGHAHGGDGHHH